MDYFIHISHIILRTVRSGALELDMEYELRLNHGVVNGSTTLNES